MSRQPDFATRPQSRRLPPWDDALVVLGLLAVVAAGALAWRARHEAREAQARLSDARREVDQQAARLRALVPSGASAPGSRETVEGSPLRIVAAVAAVLPGDARLERLTIDYAHGAALELDVETRSAASWDRLLERLERSPDFADVAPGPESRAAAVRTAIHARWSGAAR